MLKNFFGLFALITLMIFSTVNAAPIPSVTDNAGLLRKSDITELNDKIRRVEQAHKIRIGVAFVKSTGGRDMLEASHNLLVKNFSDGVNGSIVLFVNMGDRKYEVETDPRMRERISDDDGIPFLKDKFKSDLSDGDYSGAVSNFVDGVDELMTYYETNGVAYGTAVKPDGFDPMAGGIAFVIAIFCGVMIRSWLIGSMSNIRHAFEATDYLKRDTVHFGEQRDTFLFMNVQRVPRRKSRGNSGGSHGGGYGGGGGSF